MCNETADGYGLDNSWATKSERSKKWKFALRGSRIMRQLSNVNRRRVFLFHVVQSLRLWLTPADGTFQTSLRFNAFNVLNIFTRNLRKYSRIFNYQSVLDTSVCQAWKSGVLFRSESVLKTRGLFEKWKRNQYEKELAICSDLIKICLFIVMVGCRRGPRLYQSRRYPQRASSRFSFRSRHSMPDEQLYPTLHFVLRS